MPLKKSTIPVTQTTQFSKLILDYLDGKLKELHVYEPTLEGIKKFTEENKYEKLDRAALVEELKRQNNGLQLSDLTKKNIESLSDKKTYTITTGHQLCLATGPLYFVYKLLSIINLSEEINKKYSDVKFVPLYWMAGEDHDLEEVNHVHLFNKKFVWNTDQKGRVGEFSLKGIDSFLNEIKEVLGENENAKTILDTLTKAYSQKNLADATRYFVNELFGKYGLVILDGNNKVQKQQFVEEIKRDAFENFAFKTVNSTIENLKKKGYEAQVTPRAVNAFYADSGLRERIVEENGKFKVMNTSLVFSKEELQNKIEKETEKFSPNVVLRPLYQQKILPNAAYVGGPGEMAYWLEYKGFFAEAKVPFPVIMPRNFVLYVEKGLAQRMEKLNLKPEDFFGDKDKLVKNFVLKQQPFDLVQEKEALRLLFEKAKKNISTIDKTLEAAADAELQKNIKSLEALEQKAIRAIKQKSEQSVNQVEAIHARLFPNQLPQERVDNFLRFYITNPAFIDEVKKELKPAEQVISILQEV